ncbi:MAG: peptidoglycan editing factor PgeF [Erythrobacter sp.]
MADPGPLSTPFDIARSDVLEGVRHGFFGSGGGVHQFGFGGPGEFQEIAKLRAAAAHAILPGAPLQAPHQVHSNRVVTIGAEVPEQTRKWPDNTKERPVVDAVVTARRDIVLGIVTADCGPVLFSDREAGVIGAAHAGWRGAHDGVLENTVAAMEKLGASRARIAAALGPTIAQPSYEVDAAFRAHFTEDDAPLFAEAPEREGVARWHFDLPGYILAKLRASGLEQVADLGLDTYAEEQRYFSYRRASQRGQPDYGRQLSMIALG